MYTTLYHDTPPICIAMLLQKYSGQGSLEHPQLVASSYGAAIGGRPNTVSHSTVSNTELSEFFGPC